MSLLKVQDLHVNYGSIHALKGISFHVNKGEIVSLIGANGAGKTTTMRTISGVLSPSRDSSDIFLNGKSLIKIPPHERVTLGISQSPEGRGVFANMSVYENLLMGAYFRRDNEIQKDIEENYKLFPRLKEREKQMAGTLSGGEQQMLAISRALMARPEILLLDEPSLGLAPKIVQQIFSIIESLKKNGMTILLVEQNAMMALKVSDRAYVIETGECTLEGTGIELLNNPKVKESYLGG